MGRNFRKSRLYQFAKIPGKSLWLSDLSNPDGSGSEDNGPWFTRTGDKGASGEVTYDLGAVTTDDLDAGALEIPLASWSSSDASVYFNTFVIFKAVANLTPTDTVGHSDDPIPIDDWFRIAWDLQLPSNYFYNLDSLYPIDENIVTIENPYLTAPAYLYNNWVYYYLAG